MSVNGTHDKTKLLRALGDLWTRDDAVAKFGLRFDEGSIDWSYGGWNVPVASGAAGGSAYELNRALGRLQEELETRADAPVFLSLYFD